MRITELTGYKDNPIYKQVKQDVGDATDMGFDDEDDEYPFNKFYAYLQQHGFKRLGSGTWSNAYEKPGYPWVFKLFKNDPAYLWYFNYCKQHQDNPHVPKIKGNLIKISNDTFCVRMEKLTEYPSTPDYDKLLDIINNALWKLNDEPYVHKTHKTMNVMYKRDGIWQRKVEKEPYQYSIKPENLKLQQDAENYLKQHYPKLLQVLADIAQDKTEFENDLHGGNIMMRGNTPVITDPLATSAL